MDQVVGDATARQSVGQACRLERVRFAQLDSTPAARLESAPLSCDRAHAVSGLLQFRNKVRSDVAARPEDHGHTAGSGQRRRRVGLDGRHARAVYGCAWSGCLGRRHRFRRGRLRFASGPIAVPWLAITRSGLQADDDLDGMRIRLTLTGPVMKTFE